MNNNFKNHRVIGVGEDSIGVVDASSSMVRYKKESWGDPDNFHNAYLEYLEHYTDSIAGQNQGDGTVDGNDQDSDSESVIFDDTGSWNSKLFTATLSGGKVAQDDAAATDVGGGASVHGIDVCAYVADRLWRGHETKHFSIVVSIGGDGDAVPQPVIREGFIKMRWNRHEHEIRIDSVVFASGDIYLVCTSKDPLPVLSSLFGYLIIKNCPRKVPFAANFSSSRTEIISPQDSPKFMGVEWMVANEEPDEEEETSESVTNGSGYSEAVLIDGSYYIIFNHEINGWSELSLGHPNPVGRFFPRLFEEGEIDKMFLQWKIQRHRVNNFDVYSIESEIYPGHHLGIFKDSRIYCLKVRKNQNHNVCCLWFITKHDDGSGYDISPVDKGNSGLKLRSYIGHLGNNKLFEAKDVAWKLVRVEE